MLLTIIPVRRMGLRGGGGRGDGPKKKSPKGKEGRSFTVRDVGCERHEKRWTEV